MDETFQQAVQLMQAFILGNFLTGLILPAGSTLPTSNYGPIAMGGVWYFWDPTTNQYLVQSQSVKVAKNVCKNPIYQVQQTGANFTLGSGITRVYDMCQARCTLGNVLSVASDVGPAAGGQNDQILSAIKYVVGPALVTTPASTDLYVHEHLIEGSDLAPLQGQPLTLSLFAWVNQPGVYSVYLTSSGRDASFVANFTVSTANTYVRVIVPGIPALPTSIGTWNFGEGQTGVYIGVVMLVGTQWQTASPNTWQAGFFAGTNQNQNLCTVVNNTIKISGIKLEGSPTVSYLVAPPFEDDFGECIRYYWTSFNYQVQNAGVPILGQASLNGKYIFSGPFPRRMCKVPVVTPYGFSSFAAANVTDISLGNDIAASSLAANPKGLSSGVISATLVTTGTTTNASASITAIPSTATLAVGMGISGTGIPANTTITQINSVSAITISASATASGTGVSLTFTLTNKGDTLAAFIVADARLS
jgi:hypothetical protein